MICLFGLIAVRLVGVPCKYIVFHTITEMDFGRGYIRVRMGHGLGICDNENGRPNIGSCFMRSWREYRLLLLKDLHHSRLRASLMKCLYELEPRILRINLIKNIQGYKRHSNVILGEGASCRCISNNILPKFSVNEK